MTKLLLAAFMAVLALAACGGGGGGGSVPEVSVAPAPLPVVVPDVMFTNVVTSPSKTSVMPGERDVEATAFRMAWMDQSHYPISQLVFKDKSTESLWTMFKDFKLVDAAGNDVKNEAPYDIRRYEQTHEVVVNFYAYSWFPNDFGTVPKAYSLLVSVDPLAPVGTTFAFELSAVQMHDAGKTVAFDVKGGQFKVMNVVGIDLPIITTKSLQYMATDAFGGQKVVVGSLDAYCPKKNDYLCTLTSMELRVNGTVSEPMVTHGGWVYPTQRSTTDQSVFTLSNVWFSMLPGETLTFTIVAFAYQPAIWTTITDMTWVVGAEQTKVNPVIPSGPLSCGLILNDGKSCKG